MGGKAIDCLLAEEANCLIAWQRGEIVAIPFALAFSLKRGIDRNQYELARILAI